MRGNTVTIEMPLKRGKVSKTIPLYQYDYGQKLLFTGIELPAYYEVHFSNEMHGEATTKIGTSEGVDIPDVYLSTGEPVYLWLYLHSEVTDGETEFQGSIPVIKRASISDQTPTEQEATVIAEAIEALNEAAEALDGAVESAEAAQEGAEAAEDGAEEQALKAEGYAIGKQAGEDVDSSSPYYHNNAKYYNDQAGSSATAASGSASAASGSATSAESWATGGSSGTPSATNNAKYYSEQAASSASTANSAKSDAVSAKNTAAIWATGGSSGTPGSTNNAKYYSEQAAASASSSADNKTAAETAQGKAEAAQSAAETAQGKAEDAQGAAETAQGKAEDAQTAAETAQDKAEDAQDAAEAAQTAAEAAQTAAETAQGKAEDAQEAAEEAAGTMANKADKVSSATSGNFAGLDSNGNLTDSGKSPDDLLELDADLEDSTKAAPADMVGDLKSAIGKFEYVPTLADSDVVENYYVRGDTGNVVASSLYICTDYIPIPEGSEGLVLKSNCFFGSIVGAAFYNSSKTFISGIEDSGAWVQKTISVTIPTGARFFRATLQTSAYSEPSDFGISYQKTISGLANEVNGVVNDIEENTKDIFAHGNTILSLDNPNGSVSGIVLGQTSDGEHLAASTYRMTNEDVYHTTVTGTLKTDWSNFIIYIWKYENGTWTGVGWQTGNYTLSANVGYRFVIGRVNYSTADLTQEEQNAIISSTQIITHLWKTLSGIISMPRLMSRQGEGYGYPDNSIPAVKAALDDGFKMIRISVAVTSDNVFYCTHVYELANNSTLKYVKQNGSVYTEDIDINASTSTFINSLTYKDYPIPTLDTVMAEVVKHNVESITWEFKGTFTDAQLQQLIETANYYNVPVVYSGGYLEIDQLVNINANLNIAVIFNYTDSLGSGFKTRYAGKYKTMRYDCYWGDTVSDEQIKTVIHPDVKLKFGAGTIPDANSLLTNYIRWVDVSEINYPMDNFRS